MRQRAANPSSGRTRRWQFFLLALFVPSTTQEIVFSQSQFPGSLFHRRRQHLELQTQVSRARTTTVRKILQLLLRRAQVMLIWSSSWRLKECSSTKWHFANYSAAEKWRRRHPLQCNAFYAPCHYWRGQNAAQFFQRALQQLGRLRI